MERVAQEVFQYTCSPVTDTEGKRRHVHTLDLEHKPAQTGQTRTYVLEHKQVR